jgi:hypothetical protein
VPRPVTNCGSRRSIRSDVRGHAGFKMIATGATPRRCDTGGGTKVLDRLPTTTRPPAPAYECGNRVRKVELSHRLRFPRASRRPLPVFNLLVADTARQVVLRVG